MDLDALIERLEAQSKKVDADLAAARRLRDGYGNGVLHDAAPRQARARKAAVKSSPSDKREVWRAALAEAMSHATSLTDALTVLQEKGITVPYGTAYVHLRRAAKNGEYERDGKKFRYVGGKATRRTKS